MRLGRRNFSVASHGIACEFKLYYELYGSDEKSGRELCVADEGEGKMRVYEFFLGKSTGPEDALRRIFDVRKIHRVKGE